MVMKVRLGGDAGWTRQRAMAVVPSTVVVFILFGFGLGWFLGAGAAVAHILLINVLSREIRAAHEQGHEFSYPLWVGPH